MKHLPIIFLIAALLLSACAAAAPSSMQTSPSSVGNAPEAQRGLDASGGSAAPGGVDTGEAPAAVPAQPRIVLQNADLAIVVKDPQAKMLEIGAMAQRLGGYVVTSNMGQVYVDSGQKVPEGSISIRVPAKDLDAALVEIKTNTIEVQIDILVGQDVTDQYVDLQSQLKAKQAAADKLYEILQKAQTADDTLKIFNQLTQVQSEIEVLKGQINYYDQASALSSVSIRIVAEETIKPIQIAGWQPQGVARDAVQSLVDFFQGFASFLIWLVIFIIPVAAVIIILLALLWRMLRWFWRKLFPPKTPPSSLPAIPAA